MAIQKIISANNILQGSAVIASGNIGGIAHNISRVKANDIDITQVNTKYINLHSFYNNLTNESGAHKNVGP